MMTIKVNTEECDLKLWEYLTNQLKDLNDNNYKARLIWEYVGNKYRKAIYEEALNNPKLQLK